MLNYQFFGFKISERFGKKIELTKSLTKREIITRYKGSILGVFWSFLTPLMMLAVYSFVFGDILQVKWHAGQDNQQPGQFALLLFCGLMVFSLFSECINRAPSIITSNVNYVKKVVFPLEILPVVSLLSSLFNFLVSFLVWVIVYIIFFGIPPLTILLMPLVILPLILLLNGFSYLLSAIGVFVKDVGQVTGLISTALMFLSPVFYPLSSLPSNYLYFAYINPLTLPIEALRSVAFYGQLPDESIFIFYLPIAILFNIFGYYIFSKTKKAFADVI
ncbi:ABC transporter permease [Moritella sp. 28]|uniref:ABC transporter permease n=1 Tax=Moritella sp. 28 TaxID=2746232 RepID=UPI001BAA483F|nr:ABC transporter permease [Moritella sp. 28]QUM83555.1 ABC transporter permease [Moritella sp. 28]